ncbi:carbohydrate kinase family protein [Jiangella asiatica]|uniref:Carbohydrate kinase family protein n=1 Tax=Jiangella asiatica TaxID=2530372 RepID=A0A4R5DPB6_9ACTN|nr:carbohydrate kinase family protein [Jiangella asiatica]TDE14010.1 carbohydrate kinase family protein [Jiangella asiatica]
MRFAVTGSIATDYLMVFPGRFTDQLVADRLDQVSLSFLIDRLDVRRGGVAANIAYGLGSLGLRPVLVGAVGQDFEEYRAWLEENGVDTASVRVSDERHTARYLCTSDSMNNQIASFYTGAMAETREIDLAEVAARDGGIDHVIIGASDPEGMVRHTEQCRELGLPFTADFSQQIARMSGDEVASLVPGARYLFTNEYEAGLLMEKTGWSHEQVLARVGSWMTTLGSGGARLETTGTAPVTVPCVPAKRELDPTGIGDAFRAGFFAAISWGVAPDQAMRTGCLLATIVLEARGPQEYRLDRAVFVRRMADAYGEDAAAQVQPFLPAGA